jgi:hypothetical protein
MRNIEFVPKRLRNTGNGLIEIEKPHCVSEI